MTTGSNLPSSSDPGSNAAALQALREASLRATAGGPPAPTVNPFFGVGPITNMSADELERRALRFQFQSWVETNYRKLDDRGRDLGPFTVGELERSMHRGYPADKIVLDMMREIHGYFGFPRTNRMAVGLGGGHNGFTVALLHLMNAADPDQHVFIDTPRVETPEAQAAGFFRQSWGTQVIELQKFSREGDANRIHFAAEEGRIPTPAELETMRIRLFVGVGHETTGATTYDEQDIRNLIEWLDRDPQSHHALIDGTSLLGAMPWPDPLISQLLAKACFFMPFQKAVGGVAGYFAATFTPAAIELIERNVSRPGWAIPRHLKLAVPKDAKRPLTGEKTTLLGPFYDPAQDRMLGGIINTFSNTAFAETTFGILSMQKRVGSAAELNRRSVANRAVVDQWVGRHSLFELGVPEAARRGAAVTLLKVNDPQITDPAMRAAIIAKAKQLLSYDGFTHPNGDYEAGLDVARYINAFPGTPGDFRAWIGGIRPADDIVALLDNIEYCYHRARIVVIEERLQAHGITFEKRPDASDRPRKDDPAKAYKVLMADPIGLRSGPSGSPDIEEVRAYIEIHGGVFHPEPAKPGVQYAPGKIHFFYQPDLSREDEILQQTADGRYDALIAAATAIPKAAVFPEGGVRIGAGTGNMGSSSWGGGNGSGGVAPLMNTPSFNSRVTAHMVMKALLRAAPDLPIRDMHELVSAGRFDTGRDLKKFPTEKLEGRRIAVLGYGDIGREVAKLAKAFGMSVVIYARPKYRAWCESEGFEFAETIEKAAQGADFISVHTGLGAVSNGVAANAGLLNRRVFEQLNHGATLINYDRGEVVNTSDLGDALASGKVRFVCVDADLFVDASGGTSGPMAPYLQLQKRYPNAFELLPHAAADTDHPSRVEGAKQAVSQIIRAIRYREVVNLKGDLPPGYSRAGAQTVAGIGKVSAERLLGVAADRLQVNELRAMAETLAAFWGALATTSDPDRRAELIERHGGDVLLNSNRYATLVESLGLRGPYG